MLYLSFAKKRINEKVSKTKFKILEIFMQTKRKPLLPHPKGLDR
jgi:hypothetical protein